MLGTVFQFLEVNIKRVRLLLLIGSVETLIWKQKETWNAQLDAMETKVGDYLTEIANNFGGDAPLEIIYVRY